MKFIAAGLGILIICFMIYFGGGFLLESFLENLAKVPDVVVGTIFVLAMVMIGWWLLKVVVYRLFYTATKAICDAKNKR